MFRYHKYKKARETLTAYHNLIRPLNKKYPSIAQTIENYLINNDESDISSKLVSSLFELSVIP